MSSLNETPSANRLHIGIFGRRNSGKSSLINAMTNQNTAIVSDIAGTTADPVSKAMELRGIGPCVFIDTAGYDDEGELGALRVQKTKEAIKKTDVAILIVSSADLTLEKEWFGLLKENNIPTVIVINKADLLDYQTLEKAVEAVFAQKPVVVSATAKSGIDSLFEELKRYTPESFEAKSITAHLVKKGDTVMLVMPQDSEAPKGRLILPQVQTTRDLLDNECIIISVTPDSMKAALAALKAPPALIITDSQVFKLVHELAPKESKLTSFSILFAEYKGDLQEYIKGANSIENLTPNSHILIAEACTHAPLSEDIGRVKIPALLKKKYGENITVDIAAGNAFPSDLTKYDLIVHCGGCMFNRKYLISRIEQAKAQGVPITNYGVLIAKLTGILNDISL